MKGNTKKGGARGILSLHKYVFKESQTSPSIENRGRSKELIAKRNECLLDRYYYYSNFSIPLQGKIEGKLDYHSILKLLQEEFFINGEFTIPQLIESCYDVLIEIRNKRPGKSYFKNRWPHMIW